MAQTNPLSPPPSNSGEVTQNGFHNLRNHPTNTSLSHGIFDYNGETQETVGNESAFASPAFVYQDDGYDYGSQQSYSFQHRDLGLRNHYNGYSAGLRPYGTIQDEHSMFSNLYGTPAGSPPTQSISTPPSEAMRTRSGLAVNRALKPLKPLPQSRVRPPKPAKTKKLKKDKAKPEFKIAKLDKPLSELTKAWDHVPVVDIEAYVNRSVEERRKEVEQSKSPGKVKRPMNSFMLYRKAYQNRTKNWCLQNNHQIVSQVCGDSWPLEPESVREQFNEWARIERANHQNAHPGYKFSPSKAATPKSTKRKIPDECEDDSDESDLDDYDWEEGSSKRYKQQPRSILKATSKTRHPTANSSYILSREVTEAPSVSSYHRSSYQANNPGRQPPPQYSQSPLSTDGYYQPTSSKSVTHPGHVEDVFYRQMLGPSMNHRGIPAGHAYTMTDTYESQEGNYPLEHRIDPSLTAYNNVTYDDGYMEHENMYLADTFRDDAQWSGPYEASDRDLYQERPGNLGMPTGFNNLQLQDQQIQILKGGQDNWAVEPLDVGHEFDKWMDEV